MYNKKYILKQLQSIFKNGVKTDVLLTDYTSFKIGGVADFLVEPKTMEEFIKVVLFLNVAKINYYVLGNGTNVLASDQGFCGVIVKTTEFNEISLVENEVQAYSGAMLNKVCNYANLNGLEGLQDCAGIPGTVGGAVIMNASAYNYQTSDVVKGVLAIINGKITYLNNAELEFGYRSSVFGKHINPIVLRVDFALQNGNYEELNQRSEYIREQRAKNQPLDLPSAGSVFKRVDGIIISKLLDQEGFKGFTVNGARVSEKHAGFIVNYNHAKAQDVKSLIEYLKREILKRKNIVLQEEIKYLGDF